MKKVFAILLTLGLLISLSGFVSAEDVAASSSSSSSPYQHLLPGGTSIDVVYEVTSGYTVTIPVEIYFTSHSTPVGDKVVVSNALIDHDKTLVVSVKSKYNWNMAIYTGTSYDLGVGSLSYKMKYSLNNDGSADQTPSTATVDLINLDSGINDWICNLEFTLIGEANKAGTYNDILTFTASVV